MKKRILIAAGLICLLLIFAGVYAFNRINADKSLIRPEVAIETGASFSLEDFWTVLYLMLRFILMLSR